MKDEAVDFIIRKYIRTQKDIKIDRYSNKGGFGELYFGTREIFNDRVALKFYELSEGHSEPILLKEITDEHILQIIDAKVIDKKYAYFLTPEISGGDLQDVIDKYNLDTEWAVTVVQSLLKALTALHKPGNDFVHRDLKTGNVLVDKHTKKVFLSDFGTIKKIPDGTNSVTASKYSMLYRPPEAISQYKYTKQSDIYQVGIILYQVLGGVFPINDPEKWLNGRYLEKYNQLGSIDKSIFLAKHIDYLIEKGKLLDFDTLPHYVSKKLKTILKTATHIDTSKRYSNCAVFLKALYDYKKNGINWWADEGVLFAKDLKAKRFFRITKVKKEFLTESSKDGKVWRKCFSDQKIQNNIDAIENK